MSAALLQPVTALLATLIAAASPPQAAVDCDDPLPLDPDAVTREMKLETFGGARQVGPVCHLSWQGAASPSLLIYGPTAMVEMGREFESTKQAAEQYAGESPRGVEPLPGVANGYMVYDPETPNRRIFVEYQGRIYTIVSQEQIPLEVLAKAIIQE